MRVTMGPAMKKREDRCPGAGESARRSAAAPGIFSQNNGRDGGGDGRMLESLTRRSPGRRAALADASLPPRVPRRHPHDRQRIIHRRCLVDRVALDRRQVVTAMSAEYPTPLWRRGRPSSPGGSAARCGASPAKSPCRPGSREAFAPAKVAKGAKAAVLLREITLATLATFAGTPLSNALRKPQPAPRIGRVIGRPRAAADHGTSQRAVDRRPASTRNPDRGLTPRDRRRVARH